jgi:predicted metal-dependent phosphoesterase TrpH
MIDLHTHTTASDGRCTPAELVARAAAAGVTVLSVTDHDTVAGSAAAAAAAASAGIEFVNGIEITAGRDGFDIHVLGYFIDPQSPALQRFLTEQRTQRVARVRRMVERLASCGIVLDADAILQPGIDDPTRAAGRPWIARALVEAGHVKTTSEAFERWLGTGRPAFVPRAAAAPADVFARIHAAGGLASLAHPLLIGHDDWIPGFAAAGLDAIEAYHTRHDAAATARYAALARRLGLATSGGSDYHADESHGAPAPGSVSLPREAFDELRRRAAIRATASAPDTSSSHSSSNPSN